MNDWAKNFFGNNHEKPTKNAPKVILVENKFLSNRDSFRLNFWMNSLLKQREKLMLFNQEY